MLENHIESDPDSGLNGFCSSSSFIAFSSQIDPNRYNGASLLGLNKVVVKSHGNADCEAFIRSMEVAVRESQLQLPQEISRRIVTEHAVK